MDERVGYDLDDYHCLTLEVGTKRGRYDGAERTRLSLRVEHRTSADALPLAVLDVEQRDGALDIDLRGLGGERLWGATYRQLRTDLTDYDPNRLIGWHWTRYYRHIPHEDALALAESWTIPEDCVTLAAANRAAGRELYRLSRDLGWRKLTQRERARLGLDGGQWVQEEVYAAAQERLRSGEGYERPDVGEATLRAAAGGSMAPVVALCGRW